MNSVELDGKADGGCDDFQGECAAWLTTLDGNDIILCPETASSTKSTSEKCSSDYAECGRRNSVSRQEKFYNILIFSVKTKWIPFGRKQKCRLSAYGKAGG